MQRLEASLAMFRAQRLPYREQMLGQRIGRRVRHRHHEVDRVDLERARHRGQAAAPIVRAVRSILEMVMSVTPALAASIVCVQPRASRSVRMTSPE